jgi:cytochrome c-type biogenesis protein CcmH/NrfG
VATDGVDAALRHYRRLRTRHYGQAAYDFSAATLNGLAEWVADARKDLDGAIVVQRFNVETNPGIASSYALLGDLYVRKGDRASARTSFQRAAELEPANEYFRKRLEELGR